MIIEKASEAPTIIPKSPRTILEGLKLPNGFKFLAGGKRCVLNPTGNGTRQEGTWISTRDSFRLTREIAIVGKAKVALEIFGLYKVPSPDGICRVCNTLGSLSYG